METPNNMNFGLLGHVDSGKTTIAKTLSSIKSTAAFDSNPQSQIKGITLDLGFSSFVINPSQNESLSASVRITLVDCPGHSSLIKTILGAIQIMDGVFLVIDISKGIQEQTLECLALCRIIAKESPNGISVLVIFNKIDLMGEQKRSARIKGLKSILVKAFEKKMDNRIRKLKFVSISALEKSSEIRLKQEIATICETPMRDNSGQFLLAFDHCFHLNGKGTILTGTILSGAVCVGDFVEISGGGKEKQKVKSIQSFGENVDRAGQGERIGLLITNMDARSNERGYLRKRGSRRQFANSVVMKAKWFGLAVKKREWESMKKFWVNLGYENVMVFTAKEFH